MFWKFVKISYALFGIQLVDFNDFVQRSNRFQKVYSVFLFFVVLFLIITHLKIGEKYEEGTFMSFLLNTLTIQEYTTSLISVATEINLKFSENCGISKNIRRIDNLLNLNNDSKLKFISKFTWIQICFYSFYFWISPIDYYVWGIRILRVLTSTMDYFTDFMFLKFILIIYLNLCRLSIINYSLRMFLSPHCIENKSNWLISWNFLPKNLDICQVKDLTILLTAYEALCENMNLMNKKFNVLVSCK